MNFQDWSRAFGAVAIAALCVTGYNAATGGYGGAGLSLPDFNLHLPSGGSTGGSAGSAAPTVNWQLRNAGSITPGAPAPRVGNGPFRFGGSQLSLPQVALSPDDAYVGAVGSQGQPLLWRTNDGAALPTLANPRTAGKLVPGFTPDGRAVVVGMQGDSPLSRILSRTAPPPRTLNVTDLLTGEIVSSLPVPDVPDMPSILCDVMLSADASVAVCADRDGKAAAWDLSRSKFIQAWNMRQGSTDAAKYADIDYALSPDGARIAARQAVSPLVRDSGDPALPLTFWMTTAYGMVSVVESSQPVEAFALMPLNRESLSVQLVSVLRDGSVWLSGIQTAASERLGQLSPDPAVLSEAGVHPIYAVAVSRDGGSVVAAYSGFRRQNELNATLASPTQILRVDMQSRKVTRYDVKQPLPALNSAILQVAVPSHGDWLVTTWANDAIELTVPAK